MPVPHSIDSKPLPKRLGASRWLTHPTLSIVLIVREGCVSLDCRLALLASIHDRSRVEVIVMSSAPRSTVDSLRLAYPSLRFVAGGEDQSSRALRARGASEASGDVIMTLESEQPLDAHLLAWMLRSVGLVDSATALEREYRPAPIEIGRTG